MQHGGTVENQNEAINAAQSDQGTMSATPSVATAAQWFLLSAGCVLMVTGIAKLISAAGQAPILGTPDPVFGISFRQLFTFVGVGEIVVACLCFFGHQLRLSIMLVATLASGFLGYRLAAGFLGFGGSCGCLGALTDALGISPQAADWIAMALLGYLLAGSYALLLAYTKRPAALFAILLVPLLPWASHAGARDLEEQIHGRAPAPHGRIVLDPRRESPIAVEPEPPSIVGACCHIIMTPTP